MVNIFETGSGWCEQEQHQLLCKRGNFFPVGYHAVPIVAGATGLDRTAKRLRRKEAPDASRFENYLQAGTSTASIRNYFTSPHADPSHLPV
jgi:hypothetical protein